MKEKLKKIEKKNLIIIGAFLLLIIIILFGGAFIYNKFFYIRSYSEIETIMLNATKSHFDKHPNMLPSNLNESITISDSDLVAAEEMKSIAEYLKDENTTCQGKVTVTNINGKYRYVTYLNCGEGKHQTKKFIDYINETVPIVETGNGLYNLNNELVYRGDQVNNYIKFSGKIYRIVKFTDEHPVIIYTEKLESRVWDNRYNIEKEDNSGINDYSVSRIRDYLNELYQGNTLISEENKLLVTAHNLGIGKRNSKDTDKTGVLENSVILENQYIGLLQMNDFLNASLDTNCTNTTSPSCSNYNYLAKYLYNWWTITASNANSYRVFRIESRANVTSCSSNGYIRPVLYLAKDALYVSGNGSKDNPYIIK